MLGRSLANGSSIGRASCRAASRERPLSALIWSAVCATDNQDTSASPTSTERSAALRASSAKACNGESGLRIELNVRGHYCQFIQCWHEDISAKDGRTELFSG